MAALSLAALAAVGTIVGWLIYRASRPEAYTPGAETEGITRNLARGLPADAPEPRLVDVTGEAGLAGFQSFAGTRSSQLPEDMGAGVAWGDWDGDGDDDLFAVAAGGPLTAPPETWAESVLYENVSSEGSGLAFRRSGAFPGARIVGMGAAWGDYDGDGHLDLALSGYRTLRLYRNLGPEEGHRLVPDERFPPPGLDPERYWAGLSWGDYDLDRDLDLYVTGYVRYEEDPNAREQVSRQYGHAVPYTLNPVSYEPEVNLLLRNDGGGAFTEVAGELGVENRAGRSLGALWRDFDDDGRLDLYVANDVSDNALFRGVGAAAGEGTFEDIGLAAWVADYRGAMGLAAGDWNRDGDDDLFVTHWVAQENALYDNLLADQRAREEAGTGPALPAGVGFSDLAAPLGLGQIALRFVGWGTELADLDGDGWLDLLVVNGSTFERKEDHTLLEPEPPLLLWNRRGEHFHDLAPLAPALSEPHVGRGMAMADADGDGDLDLAIHHWGEGIQLLRNDMQTGRSVELALVSRGPDGSPTGRGDGAVVIARVLDPQAGETIHRRGVTGASYLSQSSATVHIGLGRAERVDVVEVRWLGGGTDTWENLDAGARWELREGDPVPRRVATFPADGKLASYAGGPSPGSGRAGAPERPGASSAVAGEAPERLTERERIARFWKLQRAGMDAMKIDRDPAKAAGLFRQALELDPQHEDAHYYLANALVSLGGTDEALEHLRRLTEINPQSHRGHKRWGTLRALTAEGDEHLEQAAAALERALELNQEETGSLLVLAEIDLLRGDAERARQHLEWATRTNPRAVGGQFLRGYLAWKAGDEAEARERLEAAREGLGPDWVPAGAVAEGDTEETMHVEESPLARFWRSWDGEPRPETAYAPLDAFLEG